MRFSRSWELEIACFAQAELNFATTIGRAPEHPHPLQRTPAKSRRTSSVAESCLPGGRTTPPQPPPRAPSHHARSSLEHGRSATTLERDWWNITRVFELKGCVGGLGCRHRDAAFFRGLALLFESAADSLRRMYGLCVHSPALAAGGLVVQRAVLCLCSNESEPQPARGEALTPPGSREVAALAAVAAPAGHIQIRSEEEIRESEGDIGQGQIKGHGPGCRSVLVS
jgi:hypothetical protein